MSHLNTCSGHDITAQLEKNIGFGEKVFSFFMFVFRFLNVLKVLFNLMYK